MAELISCDHNKSILTVITAACPFVSLCIVDKHLLRHPAVFLDEDASRPKPQLLPTAFDIEFQCLSY